MQTRKLRDYQQAALDIIDGSILCGSKNITLEATTSFGKSTIIAGICELYDNKHIVIMVNIEPLIDQISNTLSEMNIEHSILKAGRENEFDETKRINIVMSQTYYSRNKSLMIKSDILIIDERHREYDTQRTQLLIKTLEPEIIIGLTATAYDSDGFRLKDTDIVQTITSTQLTERGYLSPLHFYIPKWSEKVDYSSVKKSGSDYSMTSLDEIIGSQNHIKNIIDSMNQINAKNKKTLIFSSTIEMCDKLALALKDNGYYAEAYHSKQSSKQNKRIMDSFKNNQPYAGSDNELKNENLFEEKQNKYVKCLVSVSKLNIGFSVEDIDLGVIVRKMGPRSLYVQSGGRLKRTSYSINSILKKYNPNFNKLALVCSIYNEKENIIAQLKEHSLDKTIDVFDYNTEPEGYENIEYNVRPNKEYAEILDLAQCISVHGFPDDEYNPPKKTLDITQNKKLIEHATKELCFDKLEAVLDDNKLEQITRKSYTAKIQEIKSNKTKLSNMTIKQLHSKIYIEDDPLILMAIACTLFDKIHCENIVIDNMNNSVRGYTTNHGKLVKDFLNPKSIKWLSELWIKAFIDIDEYIKNKYTKALKTRIVNILRDKGNIFVLRFFIEFLIEQDKEIEARYAIEEPEEDSLDDDDDYLLVQEDDDVPF